MAQVSIGNVSKTYPGSSTPAVDKASLTVDDGEFVVLVGPSGCGKSTLLRMVAGLESLSAGQIHIGDRRVDELEPAERDVAMVFQNYALYPHMTARDNMAYGLKNRRFAKKEIAERVSKATRILQLEPFLDRKPRQLSGGQRQRVAIGRAIVRESACFLFDEPLSNLDAKLRVDMRAEIKALQKTLGVTSLYVTHDQVEAMTLADRVVVLNGGRIEQTGAPIEIYRRPVSVFVAEFIGSPAMNLFPAHVWQDMLCPGGRNPGVAPELPSGAATIGVRPEELRLGAFPGAVCLAGLQVVLIEELGAGRLIHLQFGDRKIVVATSAGAPPDERADIYLDRASLHFFAADGGRIENDR